MRKYLISLAAAASAMAVAAPASAQFYGGSPAYGYDRNDDGEYGRGYDRNNYHEYGRSHDRYGYGDNGRGYESRRLITANRERMAKIHHEIRSAAARGTLNPAEAARLDRRAAQFDRELAWLARDGMTGQEGAVFDARADRLAQEVLARTGNRYGYGYGNGYGDERYDRW
jgi:hypothetical protein